MALRSSSSSAKPNNGGQDDMTSSGFWTNRYQHSQFGRLEWFKPILRRKRYRMLAEILNVDAKTGVCLLELGCAPGDCLFHVHQVKPDYKLYGIDFSELGIQLTHERLRRDNIDATVCVGDFRDIKPPLKFDLVVSFGLIEHFTDPAAIIREHVRLCAPGGRVVTTVPNYATPLNRLLMQTVDRANLAAHNLDIMDLNAIENAFRSAGLTDVQVGAAGGPCIYGGGSAKSWLGQLNRCFSKVWNAAASLSPVDWPWNSTLWGVGSVAVVH